uniref:3-beta hydroxysteroid dehydrogenase/isomerase domain-containing protein n=1 Tax=Malurus cyaneus samueli TaxID=2593467 RepID=A0A8C5T4C8_9PASS
MDGGWVYLVTGGCGFVGERIVELLCQQDYIREVRVFDSVAREEVEKLSTATTRVTVTRGDIREWGALLAVARGVHVAIHTAAIVDYKDMVPFEDMRDVNVGGTENVLRACCELSIPFLIYTSSIAAVGPNTSCEPMLRGNEDTEYTGEVELPYGKTKAMAEKMVLEANGKKVPKAGRSCRSCSCWPGPGTGLSTTWSPRTRSAISPTWVREGMSSWLQPQGFKHQLSQSLPRQRDGNGGDA